MNQNISMLVFVEEYIKYRRSLGFKVADRADAWNLRNFGRYADQIGHKGSITTDLMMRWASIVKEGCQFQKAKKLGLVRAFARYRLLFDSDTEIPPEGVFVPARPHRKAPYIYSDHEIALLLRIIPSTVRSKNGLKFLTYETLFGLLVCTGLRIKEALSLTDQDVDLQKGLLTVKFSKFNKSRLVPLHFSATKALRNYYESRSRFFSLEKPTTFFFNENGKSITRSQVDQTFHVLRRKLGWTAKGKTRLPRVYDFRHSFAVNRLLNWHKEGANVDQKIPALATYLGHVNPTKTYWYLTAVPELMAIVCSKFEHFSQQRGQNHEVK